MQEGKANCVFICLSTSNGPQLIVETRELSMLELLDQSITFDGILNNRPSVNEKKQFILAVCVLQALNW